QPENATTNAKAGNIIFFIVNLAWFVSTTVKTGFILPFFDIFSRKTRYYTKTLQFFTKNHSVLLMPVAYNFNFYRRFQVFLLRMPASTFMFSCFRNCAYSGEPKG